MCNFQRTKLYSLAKANEYFRLTKSKILNLNASGDDGVEETLLPIPNRKVKLYSDNGTARGTVWESRTLPGNIWGYSSVGRALALHARGQGFESLYLHHKSYGVHSFLFLKE